MTEVSNWVTLMEGSGQQQNLGTSLWFRCAGQGKLVDRNSLVKIDEEFLLVIGRGAAKGSTRAFYSFGWFFFLIISRAVNSCGGFMWLSRTWIN